MTWFSKAGRLVARTLRACVPLSSMTPLIAVALTALTLTGCPGGPSILVFPSGFNFGTTIDTDNFTVINDGIGEVNWEVEGLPVWLTVSSETGTATPNNASTVTMTVDRTLVPIGVTAEEFVVTSNAGDVTISVSIERAGPNVPTLAVNPIALNFGNQASQRTLSILNVGSGTLDWNITVDDPAIAFSAISGSTTDTPTDVTVTLDRTGIAPGSYNAEITVTGNGATIIVPVVYLVDGAAPILAVSPLALAFGGDLTTLNFAIDNTGTGVLNYTITDDAPWLTVNPANGSATTEVDTIVATVDRTGLSTGDFTATITIDGGGGGSATIAVTMSVTPPTLIVTPTSLSFGNSFTSKLFTVRNGGTGTVAWAIDTTGFPSWLSVNVTSGTVTTETDAVIVTVDRTGLPPGVLAFSIPVNSSTPGAGSATVAVSASVGVAPLLTIDTGALNPPPDEQPLANLGSTDLTFEYTISNTGTGTLNWTIDPAQFPSWMTMAPVAGTLTSGQSETVTITVSRTGLPSGGFTVDVEVESNGGNVIVEVQMQVPLRPVIGTDISNIDFGIDGDSAEFGVANFGDPGTLLNFVIESDKEWLFFSPEGGTSIGTSSPIKDFRSIAVAIDRGNLDGTGATGTLTITARDFEGNIIPDVAPVTVTVSVEAAELTFEGALIRQRIPSLLRFPFILRDFRDRAIPVAPDQLPVDAFQITERSVPLDLDESSQFVTSGARLRTNIVILLDYTGSLFNAASQTGVGGVDPLQDIYTQEVTDFINDAPANWQIALMEFHERSQGSRLVQDFTTDKAVLINALQNINVDDHGASELLGAIDDANIRLVNEDFPLVGFDDADVRGVVLVSDGRLTTPPGNILDTIDLAETNRMRLFAIGWGIDVNNEPLARVANASGGHYYPTLNTQAGIPQVSELSDRLDQVLNDLQSQLVLSYVTLTEADNVPVRINGVFDNPLDNPDEGVIQGSLEQVLNLLSIVGDIRFGQVSMRSSGVSSGNSTVIVRADYVPRNVNEFQFTLSSTEPFTVTLTPAADGGLVEDWTLTALGGGVFNLAGPVDEFLPYGAFGDLLNVEFTGPAVPFSLELAIDNTLYALDTEPKFFYGPDNIDVDADGALAPAFPTPFVQPLALNFGSATNSLNFTIQNIGGAYPPFPAVSDIVLNWETSTTAAFLNEVLPDSGSINTATAAGLTNVTVTVDRTLPPGVYGGSLIVAYNTGDIDLVNISNSITIPVSISIQPPVLNVSPTTRNFGAAITDLTIDITNTGQSTLDWTIDDSAFPAYLSISQDAGTTTSETDTITITVDRTGLASGTDLGTTFTIESDGGSQVITIQGTVP